MKRVIRLVLSSLCAAAVMLGAAGCSGDPKVSTAEPATLPVIGPDSSLPTGTAAPSPSAAMRCCATPSTISSSQQ